MRTVANEEGWAGTVDLSMVAVTVVLLSVWEARAKCTRQLSDVLKVTGEELGRYSNLMQALALQA